MAMPRKLPVDFGLAFPYGAYMVGEIKPLRDYDRSTKDQAVQATDPDTGVLLWTVEVVDADPEVSKSARTVTVKVPAKVQPVLEKGPEGGGPFTPVEFNGMTATAWLDDSGNFARLAWSLRAQSVSNVAQRTASRSSDKDKAAA